MRLAVEGLEVRFGATTALSEVTLHARPGERVAVIGPNGAGKTTLLDAISGLVIPTAGHVALFGETLTGLDPDQIARRGVARTFQSPRLFARMTVEENLRAGRGVDADPWLDWSGLAARRGELAGALTPGEARRLELARAVAAAPHLLLLDEPTGGLAAAESLAMIALIRQAATPGRITLVVEHKLGVVGRLCERAVVLHLGLKIFDGPVADLSGDAGVLEAYLGRAAR